MWTHSFILLRGSTLSCLPQRFNKYNIKTHATKFHKTSNLWKRLDQTKPLLFIFLFLFKEKIQLFMNYVFCKTLLLVAHGWWGVAINKKILRFTLGFCYILILPQQYVFKTDKDFEWRQKSLQWFLARESNKIPLTFWHVVVCYGLHWILTRCKIWVKWT